MRYVVCYDVVDDRRRNRVADTLKDYGRRVQYSVFVADLDEELAHKMIEAVRREVSSEEDKVHVFLLCRACCGKAQMFGLAETPKDEPYYII
jgi:CRISPR-associated protein Cas2